MQAHQKIGIVGCGNMGQALVENLCKGRQASDIYVFDKAHDLRDVLVKRFGVCAASSIQEAATKGDAVIIAVKPQDIDGVLSELKDFKGKLFISIAAGISLAYLASVLGEDAAVVRAMPNLNAMIGRSVTALSPNARVSPIQRSWAEEIFKAVGETVFVEEDRMNAVTAISGSGPAFVAYLIKDLGEEALERVFKKEAAKFRIGAEEARVMARGTIEGTKAILALNFDAATLIRRVSSKGGTTEAGMKVLEERGKTEEALSLAIDAAQRRAAELARR